MSVLSTTVIILNYNGRDDLEHCLPSVLNCDCAELRVLLVDNASTDDSVSFVKTHFPTVQLLCLDRNYGFAEGNNRGLEQAFSQGASHAVLLNSDTRVDAQWLTSLQRTFMDDPLVGICGSVLYNWDGSLIEFDGSVFHPVNASGGYVDQPAAAYSLPESDFEAGYACGAALAISRECYEEIGGFDPDFLFYNEDVDISLRAWIYGFRVKISSSSKVYHKRGSSFSTGNYHTIRDYMGLRNALTTVIKNYQLCTIRCVYRDILRIYLSRTLFFKGLVYNLLHLPAILKKRMVIQRARLRSDEEIFKRVRCHR